METLIVQKVTELPVKKNGTNKRKSKYASLLKNAINDLLVGEHYKLVLPEGQKTLSLVRSGLKLHARHMGLEDSIVLTQVNGVLYVTRTR